MDAVKTRLRRLRIWFVAWFVIQAAAGTAVAAFVLDGLRDLPWPRFAGAGTSAEVAVGAGILVSALLLLLALLVFDALIDCCAWARFVLLVVGWLTVGSAFVNLLLLPSSSALLESLTGISGGYGLTLTGVSVVTKAGDLVFWVWVIHTLQFDRAVRDAFLDPRMVDGVSQ
jgi:hypothetical protein